MSSVLKVDTIQNTGGTTGLTIDSSGRILTSTNRPAFFANLNASITSTTAGAGIVYNATSLNQGSHYSTSTGKFTAPVAGLYWFGTSVLTDMDGTDGYCGLSLLKNGTIIARDQAYSYLDNDYTLQINIVISLAASNYITITSNRAVYGSTDGYTHFSGYLIG
jgi:hypothetical protein